MFTRFFTKSPQNKLLFFLIVVSYLIRFVGFVKWSVFFGDQAWYLVAARDALLSGKLPLLGITTSITWLHQGPLWTYLIVPVLVFSRFHPLSENLFMIVLSGVNIPLAFYLGAKLHNRQSGLIYATFMSSYYFLVFHTRLGYHTSPIPFLFNLTLLLILTGRSYLSGIFIGLLYQSHLLTFIYWPLFWFFSYRHKTKIDQLRFFLGFVAGVLPMIIAGPIQTFGIFIWLVSRLFLGFSSAGLISQSYLVVISAPIVLLISLIVPKIKGHILALCLSVFVVFNFIYLVRTGYLTRSGIFGLTYPRKLELSERLIKLASNTTPQITIHGPGSKFASTRLPYLYFFWRYKYLGGTFSGTGSAFLIDEFIAQVRVLE